MIQAALDLAGLGWPVFPCHEVDISAEDCQQHRKCEGHEGKQPYTFKGFHDASTDPALIRKWWNYRPGALIGLAVPTEILVIDIDPRNGGSRDKLEVLCGPLPVTATAWSGRGDGGHHLYFLRPVGDLSGLRLKPHGIDLKDADRGYVITPPSPHPDTGEPYRWEHEDTIALLPYRLWELLQPEPISRTVFSPREGDDYSQLLSWVAATPEGSRDDHAFFAACRLAEKGALDSYEEALIEAALATGISEAQARKCITSARRRVGQ